MLSKKRKVAEISSPGYCQDFQQIYGMPVTVIPVVFGCMVWFHQDVWIILRRSQSFLQDFLEIFRKRQSLEPFTPYEPSIYDWLLSYVL